MTGHRQAMITRIEDGDAGVVLKQDGSFFLFNTHKDIDPANLTDAQQRQGEILAAFKIALLAPQVLQVLLDCASDPEVIAAIEALEAETRPQH